MYILIFFVNNIIGDIMDDKYLDIVDKHTPKEDRLKNAIVTFIAGGVLGALCEFLLRCYMLWFSLPRKEAGVVVILLQYLQL